MKKNSMKNFVSKEMCLLAYSLIILLFSPVAATARPELGKTETVVEARQINPTTIEVVLSGNQRITFDFYGENIFRLFRDDSGGILREPEAKPEAQILVDNPRKPVSGLKLDDRNGVITVSSAKISIEIDKTTCLLKVRNLETNTVAFEELEPMSLGKAKTTLTLKGSSQEYFYGGGVQNGRFSHKGRMISIENQNSWVDGGVASPTPYYWSTNGYALMWHTFKKGRYDFGANEENVVKLYHETDYLDVFFMVNDGAVPLLNDFYQLTGNPVLLPKFGFYQGHLNAYNRDYWVENEAGILFEDGKKYKEGQQDKGGVKESLNGEKNNYQFSARAVVDRYKKHDMPLGWVLPNDGYGAGYGQTETLDGNIQNLKEFGDYARANGVEIGLWTQSDLHPKPEISALLQRDIVKEVRDAGVRVLKTDVAWVGAGYSFGLNGVADVAQIMSYYGSNSRPFIISLDGWAGTQRYAGIWSGDQTGGVWEYIRFHIPTYIGSGLSGQPNISSDMDGIFGGKNPVVNIRDFQWKTWTPMQLNMDGWGSNEKYPHALGEPATSINRWYLKLKSEIMPYAYSIARESVDGLPMIRAMFLEYPNAYTLGKSTQYQFLYGPNFLVAPIYQETKVDEDGNDVRNGIYLPEGTWIDYFSGEEYKGGNTIINSFDSPLWKLPVFVKAGAIIPLTNPNNNVGEINTSHRIYEFYPAAYSSFTEYDDDGMTEEYRQGKSVTTFIESNVDARNKVTLTVHPASGDYDGFVKNKSTEFRVNITEKPKKVLANIGKKRIKLTEVKTIKELTTRENVYFYDAAPNLNRFATPDSEFAQKVITGNPKVYIRLEPSDITSHATRIEIEGYVYAPSDSHRITSGALQNPGHFMITEENTEAYTLKPTWNSVGNADFYEIDFNGMLYTTIKDTELLFDGLEPETEYLFRLRAVNRDGNSDWVQAKATTKSNPLEFAIKDITGETSVKNQGGEGVAKLFDFDEGTMWHTAYGQDAMPFDLIMDLHTINQLDKIHYLPRISGLNGNLMKGTVSYSLDKENWTEAGSFDWERGSADTKVFEFKNQPTARYIKFHITEGVGNFGSGREIYVFKVPGTESVIPGDINNDGKIDRNDLVSYTNYTGLRKGDADFEGYISNGDINGNGLIDAYDISIVATQLENGIDEKSEGKVDGKLEMSVSKQNYTPGETVEIYVKGVDLQEVNALSFALTYDPQDYEFESVQSLNMKNMMNLTNDRLHTNGVKALYPTFVNIGSQETLQGSIDLFVLKFKAKRNLRFNLKIADSLLVDKNLHTSKTDSANTF